MLVGRQDKVIDIVGFATAMYLEGILGCSSVVCRYRRTIHVRTKAHSPEDMFVVSTETVLLYPRFIPGCLGNISSNLGILIRRAYISFMHLTETNTLTL